MNTKFIKFNSTQTNIITSTQNLVDFQIPSADYNMKESYVYLYTNVNTTESGTGDIEGSIYPVDVRVVNRPEENFSNLCFVKNCYLSSDKHGKLEDIRRNDILKNNLQKITKSRLDMLSESYENVKTIVDTQNTLGVGQTQSYFRNFHKTGIVPSENLTAPIKIRLSDLFDLGKLQMLPGTVGNLHMHLEMNVSNFEAVVQQSLVGGVPCNNFTDARTAIVVTQPYNTVADSPFVTGQKVKVNATNATAANSIVN